MVDVIAGPPWPASPFVLDLDGLGEIDLGEVASLEGRSKVSIGAVAGDCVGSALATAMAVDLLVAGPEAKFGRPGPWADTFIRRGTLIVGRKTVAYIVMTDRLIGAADAHRWGLVTVIAEDPAARAVALAERITRRAPAAVAAIIRQAHRGAAEDYMLSGVSGGVPGARPPV